MLPQHVAHVRHDWPKQEYHCAQRFLHHSLVLAAIVHVIGAGEFRDFVVQLHHRRNCGVEYLALVVINRDFLDRAVRLEAYFFLRVVEHSGIYSNMARFETANQFPQPFQEAISAVHTAVGPFQTLVRGRGKHHIQAHGIGTVLFDHAFGVDSITNRLRHLGAVFQHHALRQQALERLVAGDQPLIAH